MISKTKLKRYADVMVWALTLAREKKLKKGDIVRIVGDIAGTPLMEEIYARLLAKGFNAMVVFNDTPKMEVDYYKHASGAALEWVPPWSKHVFKHVHGSIYVHAPDSLMHLKGADTKKIAKSTNAMKPIRDLLDKREEMGDFGWTVCVYPTQELADQAGLTLKQYTNQVEKACWLHKANPVAEWEKLYRSCTKLKNKLNRLKVDHYHIESKNMDLKIWPGEERRWYGISGHNIPSFEIFLSPDCRKTEGTFWSDQPSFKTGNYVEDVKLEFEKGKVVKATARKGQKFLLGHLNTDPGASFVGEFSLTDKRFSKINKFMANTLFDENFGGRYGNMHLAVGNSYVETYTGDVKKLTKAMKKKLGFNYSAIHWDLVNTEKKKVTAYSKSGKKKVIYENGQFTYKV